MKTMNMTKRALILPVLLATAVMMGCDGVGPTSPAADWGEPQLTGALAKGGNGKGKNSTTEKSTTEDPTTVESTTSEETTEILTRIHPLSRDLTASAVIGEEGGWIGVQGGGLGLWVPAGALNQPVEITITAYAGDKLAYDFQPHGTKFKKPVRIGILNGLGFGQSASFGVYFEGDHKGKPKFLENFNVWSWQGFTMFETTHFSGYALASGARKKSGTLTSSSF